MSTLGHVWTTPWQEFSDVAADWSGAVRLSADVFHAATSHAHRIVSRYPTFSGAEGIDLSAGGRSGDRWVKDNKTLKGDQLKAAVDKQGWDDSGRYP